MSWREVTKDDVGKMVEVRDQEGQEWSSRELEHVLSRPDINGMRFLVWGTASNYPVQYRHARIRTSPLPDGWLPDDWRILDDEEACQRGDYVVCGSSPSFEFDTENLHFVDKGYVGMLANDVIAGVSGNLCVIRPRYRPAKKDDVNKIGIGKYDDAALIKAIVERDNQGYDAWCLHKERGWCVARLSEMKVENEGWHVTN